MGVAVMAWSTSQLAELAGTSLRAIRHYHHVGLLDEPERRANGYKRYKVEHLMRVLRIRRLSDMGFSLAQIAEMGEADEYPEQALQALDTELAGTIERLQRARTELALVLRKAAPTDLPPEMALAAVDAGLTAPDRSLAVVLTRLMSPEAQKSYTEVLQGCADPAEQEFAGLPADADQQTRRDLAERMAPVARDALAGRPELRDYAAMAPGRSQHEVTRTLSAAMTELYNPAQLDVLKRVKHVMAANPAEDEQV